VLSNKLLKIALINNSSKTSTSAGIPNQKRISGEILKRFRIFINIDDLNIRRGWFPPPIKQTKGRAIKPFSPAHVDRGWARSLFGCSSIVIYAGKQTRALFNRLGLLEKSSSFLVS